MTEQLLELSDPERLKIYEHLLGGVKHFWSKNKFQEDKFKEALETHSSLCLYDPNFLVHLAAWACSDRNKSRDFKMVAVFLNALSDADGSLFVEGGTLHKPNYRKASVSLLSAFNPKELYRISLIKSMKWVLRGVESTHFPSSLAKGMARYITSWPNGKLEAYVKSRHSEHIKRLYRRLHLPHPQGEAAQILRWADKNGSVRIEKRELPFVGLSSAEIALKIKRDKIKFGQAVSWMPAGKIDIPVAEALLSVATANEALIQRNLFDEAGLLAVPELAEKYFAKIKKATATDRVDRITTVTNEKTKEKLAEARTAARRSRFKFTGKISVGVDISGSLKTALETAKNGVSSLVDIVAGDEKRFSWACFNERALPIPEIPKSKEHAHALLYNFRADGGTNCFAHYRAVQALDPVEVYIWITDGGHRTGSTDISDVPKPKVAIVILVPGSDPDYLSGILRKNGMEPVYLKPEVLKESALVEQAITSALLGSNALIDEIMATPIEHLL